MSLMKTLWAIALLLLVACGRPDTAATATRGAELRQLATLTAPTTTRPQLSSGVPRPSVQGTLPPIAITATSLATKKQATAYATAVATCEIIASEYARVGRVFDPVTAARNVQLAELDLHLVEFGTTDPVTSKLGQQRERQYLGYLHDCIGL